MVFREQPDCRRCNGHGVVAIKTREGIVEVICGCTVGKMVAATVVPKTARQVRRG